MLPDVTELTGTTTPTQLTTAAPETSTPTIVIAPTVTGALWWCVSCRFDEVRCASTTPN